MNESKSNFIDIVKLGGAYIAFCIGSGYASGQEIMQFFTSFGYQSFLAALVSLVLFTWMGYYLMKQGRELKFQSDAAIFKYFCGDKIGTVMEWFTVIFLFSCFVIMLAGSGAALQEHFGLSPYIGRALMALLAIATVLMGLNRLVDIIGAIGPVIIVFSLVVGIGSTLQNLDGLKNAVQVMETVNVPHSVNNWALSGALYAGYMAVIVLPFLIQLSQTAKNTKTSVWGGTIGGFALIFAVIVMNLGLLANIGSVYDKSIPSLVLASGLNPLLGGLFTIILMGGIYSSAIPMLWMICNKFAREKTKKYNTICIGTCIAAFILSGLSFTELVGIVYPYTGYVGLFIMICVFIRQFINKGDIAKYQKLDAANAKKRQEEKEKAEKNTPVLN